MSAILPFFSSGNWWYLVVLLPSFAFLRSDERLDEVGGALYLQRGEECKFPYHFLLKSFGV